MVLDTKKLIAAVKLRRILYDSSVRTDTTVEDKEIIWNQIADECNIGSGGDTGIIAKQIWKELLYEYMQYLRHGLPCKDAKEICFMQTHLVMTDLLVDSSSDAEIDNETLENLNSDNEIRTGFSTNESKTDLPSTTKKRKLANEQQFNTATAKHSASSNSVTENNAPAGLLYTKVNNLSALELIFLGYAQTLQKMPIQLQIQTKRKIANIMDEAEMQYFEGQ